MHPARLAALGLLLAPVLLAARTFTVVAYNVENLFDLDGQAQFEEYQPDRYTPAHALTKLRNTARVLARYEGFSSHEHAVSSVRDAYLKG